MDRSTAKMIREISVRTKRNYRSLKRYYYSLNSKMRCKMKNEMKIFISKNTITQE